MSIDNDLDKLLDQIKGMGKTKSQLIANVVRAWLSEKSIISTNAKAEDLRNKLFTMREWIKEEEKRSETK